MLLTGVKSELNIIPFRRHNLQLFYIFPNKKLTITLKINEYNLNKLLHYWHYRNLINGLFKFLFQGNDEVIGLMSEDIKCAMVEK